MTKLAIDRSDPATLVPAARQLYAEGKGRREVLEAIYGVDLPAEALRFHEARRPGQVPVSALYLTHPWALVEPPGEVRLSNLSRRIEPSAFAQAPSMIPLLVTSYDKARLGDHLLGYDIDELRAGRTTIVGSRWPVDTEGHVGPVREVGGSLLATLHGCIDEYATLVRRWMRDPRSGYEQVHLNRAEAQLRAIEVLQAGP